MLNNFCQKKSLRELFLEICFYEEMGRNERNDEEQKFIILKIQNSEICLEKEVMRKKISILNKKLYYNLYDLYFIL